MEQQRQLAAIMFTDIVGYTRLMGSDEDKAFQVLTRNRELQLPLIEQFNGKFIKELGDGTMASFNNAIDAVRCAIEIQQRSKDDPELNLRIGIHSGEVVFENDDVFGDGVNVAARIESAGRPGAVFISGPVHGNVQNKADIKTRFIEQMQLKNVNRPIDIYEVAIDGKFSESAPKKSKPSNIGKFVGVGIAVALLMVVIFWFAMGSDGTSGKQLDHASIAVLPFENMSPDPDNEFFCDGVTEDILTHLSKLKNLKVISRTSIMHFKGSDLTLPEIAKELDVEYIVEGSVRKHGDQVAITAQLIHAESDGHLWAENYERSLENVFAIQREVAQEITKALNINISLKEREGLGRSSTNSVGAYQLFLKAREVVNDRSEAGIRESIKLLEEAVELDPLYANAYSELAHSILLARYYINLPMDSCERLAREALETALEIDPNNAFAHVAYGELYLQKVRDFDQPEFVDEMVAHAEKALELDPNMAYAHFKYSQALDYVNDSDPYKSLKATRRAAELDPYSVSIKSSFIRDLSMVGMHQEAWDVLIANESILPPRIFNNRKRTLLGNLGKWNELVELCRSDIKDPSIGSGVISPVLPLFALCPSKESRRELIDELIARDLQIPLNYWIYFLIESDSWPAVDSIMNTTSFLVDMDERSRQQMNALFAYHKGKYEFAEATYATTTPNHPNRYYCWTQMGMADRARDSLLLSDGLDQYSKTFIWAGLGELDSALHHFELVDSWERVSIARLDRDLESLWEEPGFKAKVASYNFPSTLDLDQYE